MLSCVCLSYAYVRNAIVFCPDSVVVLCRDEARHYNNARSFGVIYRYINIAVDVYMSVYYI